jgi:hypothetical protein
MNLVKYGLNCWYHAERIYCPEKEATIFMMDDDWLVDLWLGNLTLAGLEVEICSEIFVYHSVLPS